MKPRATVSRWNTLEMGLLVMESAAPTATLIAVARKDPGEHEGACTASSRVRQWRRTPAVSRSIGSSDLLYVGTSSGKDFGAREAGSRTEFLFDPKNRIVLR
jgi:hypothetical protein